MKILFITQKIDTTDSVLAFVIGWVDALCRQGVQVSVLCLERGAFDDHFPVYSLGKEAGAGRMRRLLRLWRLIRRLEYDAVFVHMNPEYLTAAGLWWRIRHTPVFLWYTHPAFNPHLLSALLFCKKLFCATAQSMPFFSWVRGRVVTGHGIDLAAWGNVPLPAATARTAVDILAVHRIDTSKRLEIAIGALAHLPDQFTLTVYGAITNDAYAREMRDLAEDIGCGRRVRFMGPVSAATLRDIYPRYRLMINMARNTLDKTMLEAMAAGVYPVVPRVTSFAMGLPAAPEAETAESAASFIKDFDRYALAPERLRAIVGERHNLDTLMARLVSEMKPYITKPYVRH